MGMRPRVEPWFPKMLYIVLQLTAPKTYAWARDWTWVMLISIIVAILPWQTSAETTSPAPLRFTRRRNGRSVTPDIGARITGSSSFTGPIWMLTFSSLVWLAQKLSRVIGRRFDAAKQKSAF